MLDLLPVAIPILLTDILNPVLFAFMVYALGTARPIANSVALLLGHTLAYFVVGVVLAAGLESISERLNNPEPVDFYIELGVGMLLLCFAVPARRNTGKRPQTTGVEMTLVGAFSTGAVVNFIGIPFALPYFAMLGQILKADLSTGGAITVLMLYNIAYALPFALIPAAHLVLGERSRELLAAMNERLDRIASVVLPLLLALVGLALVVDATSFVVTGSALF